MTNTINAAPAAKPYAKYIKWIVLAAVLLIIIVPGCSSYNTMNRMSKEVDQAWAQVQVQYQRRSDLIPNLVNSVQGYTAHESGTLEAVTNARAGLLSAENAAQAANSESAPQSREQMQNFLASQERLKSALSLYVNAVREAYPDLKANTLFQDLNAQLEGTENRIATERGRYTRVINDYNIKVSSFPSVIFAKIFGFGERPQFEASAEAQSAPVVNFSTSKQ